MKQPEQEAWIKAVDAFAQTARDAIIKHEERLQALEKEFLRQFPMERLK